MVKLITPVQVDTLPPLAHADPVVAIGSCFVQAMGRRLLRSRFDALVNRHGTLFNPVSIAKTIRNALSDSLPSPESFILRGDLYAHTDYHSDLARSTVAESLRAISEANAALRAQLHCAHWLIITLGTAWVYRTEQGEVATNCHKIPARCFTRELLPVQTVVDELANLIDALRCLNHNLRILLTVSPVRHLNDGMRENAVSKSTLLLAAHQLRELRSEIHYFPAYEMLIDELRDYRYYADDLVHPSDLAEEIVWERLQEVWMPSATRQLAQRHEALARSLAHRPSSITSAEYQRFVAHMLLEMEELERITPRCSYERERKVLRSMQSSGQ